MSHALKERPAICLNMIVKNEAHIVHEVLDMAAPHITSWVIVDTGSTDGTQEFIRSHMAGLGIPGELYERPWHDFGHNRSEALGLAQGHGDYIWVMDADDTVVGAPDFSDLDADVYAMRIRDGLTTCTYWRRQLFRDGMRWRYEGVVHEYPHCDDPFVEARLDGDYYIDSRRLGGRNLDPQKYVRDRDLLLAEVERNPDDARSVFYLAQSYFSLGDFANACKWDARRTQMGGWAEEVYHSMLRVGEAMSRLGAAWPEVQDVYLRAWEFRPTRAEALHAIATRYRSDQRYQLGYVFARRAAEIPFPTDDTLFVGADIYHWRATDEQAVCASWIGRHAEAFTLYRRLLTRDDIPDDDRKRLAGNRDVSAPAMIDAASAYPDALARHPNLTMGRHDGPVTTTLVAGPNRHATEQTLNSFMNCCLDLARVDRFVVIDGGLSAEDRATLLERYPFLEFCSAEPNDNPHARLAAIRPEAGGRFWLHLGQEWRFFAPERLITRLVSVLETETEVFQVGINVGDARTLTGDCAAEESAHRTYGAGRYVLGDVVVTGPAMFETSRLDRVIGADRSVWHSSAEFGRRAAEAGLRTATLDEVLCVARG
jgi:tetratricopeptide (TPR) repeat protein